ncbi:hypothetical protein [Sphaerisporangium krabiense]|uniref:DUF2178 domain-containing protein n=1 Tax=Sphaerisporangium krabiense TaxID=763782 RepID=A0A7W9DN47_9ACTN|nr:hypothetical protein [Sphaerisporangium krabiense]MBB5624968.1 hypothetical protein [Sphaerisporangium krabiense]
MPSEEKNAWIMGLVAIGAYAIYAVIILGRAGDAPLADVPYAATMLWTIGGGIVAGIVLNIAVAVASPRDAGKKDVRDREIYRFGEHIGQSFVAIGGVAVILMALAEWDTFWIANAMYLAFVLSAILSSIAKIAAYRWGFQPW